MHHRPILAAASAVTGGVLMVAGWALLGGRQWVADAGALSAAPASSASAQPHQPSPPRSIRSPNGLPALQVEPVASDPEGSLRLPLESDRAGWWALGAAPGSLRGTVLIAGHVDTSRGLGSFSALHDLPLGSRIEISGSNGHRYVYRIAARRTYPRPHLPADLFTREGGHRLALITCTGPYDSDTGGYADNLVLYGTPDA